MKTVLMVCALLLTLLPVETSRGQGDDKPAVVRIKNPGDRAGYLGVSIQDMTRRLARDMEMKTDEGALVDEVIDDSPAEEAGIKEKDVIVEIDGKKIIDAEDLRSSIGKATPGTKVTIVAMRKDEKKTFTATIDKTPRSRGYAFSVPGAPRTPRPPRAPRDIHIFSSHADLGMTISSLNKQLGKYFEAPDGKGVLVQEVEEDSRAAKAGFLAGDVIIRIGKETIKNVEDVTDALDGYKEDEKADVEVIRKGSRKAIVFEVPDMDRPRRFHLGSGHGLLDEFDMDIDPPDVEWEWDNGESLKENIRDLEMQLRDFGRDLHVNAKKLKLEIGEKIRAELSRAGV